MSSISAAEYEELRAFCEIEKLGVDREDLYACHASQGSVKPEDFKFTAEVEELSIDDEVE